MSPASFGALLVGLLGASLAVREAEACTCLRHSAFKQNATGALVVLGRVTQRPSSRVLDDGGPGAVLEVSVERVLQGEVEEQPIAVARPGSCAALLSELKRDKQYVFALQRDTARKKGGGTARFLVVSCGVAFLEVVDGVARGAIFPEPQPPQGSPEEALAAATATSGLGLDKLEAELAEGAARWSYGRQVERVLSEHYRAEHAAQPGAHRQDYAQLRIFPSAAGLGRAEILKVRAISPDQALAEVLAAKVPPPPERYAERWAREGILVRLFLNADAAPIEDCYD
jgi:hypothetical protein